MAMDSTLLKSRICGQVNEGNFERDVLMPETYVEVVVSLEEERGNVSSQCFVGLTLKTPVPTPPHASYLHPLGACAIEDINQDLTAVSPPLTLPHSAHSLQHARHIKPTPPVSDHTFITTATMRLHLLPLTLLAALTPAVFAVPQITSPAAGATLPAGSITVKWTDDGTSQSLSQFESYTLTLFVGGNLVTNAVCTYTCPRLDGTAGGGIH